MGPHIGSSTYGCRGSPNRFFVELDCATPPVPGARRGAQIARASPPRRAVWFLVRSVTEADRWGAMEVTVPRLA